MIYKNVLETIGKTPIVKLSDKFVGENSAEVYVKLEYFNPGGSVKDRPALYMINEGMKQGKINKDTILIEPTSGNTGIGLAMASAVLGLKLKLVMPESMTEERRRILKAYGAELILTPKEKGMGGAVAEAERLVKETPNSIMPNQFANVANVKAHLETTAKEILLDLPDLDAFIAGVGTGGTISGVGKAFKEMKKKTKFIAVEPEESPVLSGGSPSPHKIQGIGAGFVPAIFDRTVVDEIRKVNYENAKNTARALATKEGIFAGVSSGAAVYAALQIAKELGKGKKVLAIIPDTGERYLSTELYQ